MLLQEVKVKIPGKEISYPILIEEGIREELAQLLTQRYQGDKILLVTDENLMNLYGNKTISLINEVGFKVINYVLPPGERAKVYQYLKTGYDILLENNFQRDNLIIALGGGVVGDLTGFLAATFMRGLPFMQIPTTLLAQVDSSVGGKTAINHPFGKNLIGAFYQPELVVIDPDFLQTLPKRELITGMAEVIKYGLIADREFIRYLLDHKKDIFNLESEVLINIIKRSCSIKAEIVREDEKEEGIRAILNFGHTIAHGLEALTNYHKYNHGEAVAIGMVGAGRLAFRLGYLDGEELRALEQLIKLYELPDSLQYGEDVKDLFQSLFYDKKMKGNKLRWILLNQLGHAFIKDNVDNKLVKGVLEGLI